MTQSGQHGPLIQRHFIVSSFYNGLILCTAGLEQAWKRWWRCTRVGRTGEGPSATTLSELFIQGSGQAELEKTSIIGSLEVFSFAVCMLLRVRLLDRHNLMLAR